MKNRNRIVGIATLMLASIAALGCGNGDGDPTGTIQVPPPGPTVVELRPSAFAYSMGEIVTLDVAIRDGRDVGSVPFHLHFDPSVVQFQPPATEGPYLGADGTLTVFLASESAAGGELVVGMSRLGAIHGAQGSGSLATVEFLTVGPGPCGFRFSAASVKDPQAQLLPATFNSAAVDVTP